LRIGLFTNNYLPFCGGVTISVETLRRGLEARGHEVWTVAPRFPGARDAASRVIRVPSVPAAIREGVAPAGSATWVTAPPGRAHFLSSIRRSAAFILSGRWMADAWSRAKPT